MNTSDSAAVDVDQFARDLERTFHVDIPISKAMGVTVASFDRDVLVVTADLAPNINIHGTAFAGSLYAINALCGWGMTHLQLALRRLTGSIVIADGHIQYTRPVQEQIRATCRFGDQTDAWTRLDSTGKTRFDLQCSISANGEPAAEFSGQYAVRIAR